jgi:DNA-binding CsgD family transcriptional regulator
MSDEELLHYGMPRRSGRYPWGSGDNPFQHGDNIGVYRYYRQFRAAGKTDAEIASSLGMSTTQLRAIKSLGTNELRNENYVRAMKLKEKGLSNIKIGEMLGMNESSVRSLLDQSIKANKDRTMEAADTLKAEVNRVKYLDIGPGANLELGITDT